MDKSFEFIDSTKSDRLTKRLVRSHAMKGKNAGKKLHRRSRLDLYQPQKCNRSLFYEFLGAKMKRGVVLLSTAP